MLEVNRILGIASYWFISLVLLNRPGKHRTELVQMSQTPIDLKGSNFTLSVVHLNTSHPEQVRQALTDKITQAPTFLQNAPVVINIAAVTDHLDWPAMQQAISSTGLKIVGVSGCSDKAVKAQLLALNIPLLNAGKAVATKQPTVAQAKVVAEVEKKITKARIVDLPVRSGQQIYARDADLIVTNSVSAGAELVADGNIHIYGMMRGRALAGASGDQQARIYCTNLAAELVSIAGEYWIMDQIPSEHFGRATRLSLQDGALAIESLN